MATAAAGSPLLGQGPAGSVWTPAAPHPAVVRVMSPLADGAAFGSGTLVAVNRNCGLVVTNWHVVRDAAGAVLGVVTQESIVRFLMGALPKAER